MIAEILSCFCAKNRGTLREITKWGIFRLDLVRIGASVRSLSIVLVGMACCGGSVRGEQQDWQKPLAVKERLLNAGILARHNILGLYPSMVEIPPRGGPVDITTATPFSDIAHAVCWTSNHLAGASYRYRFLKDSGASAELVEAARLRADQLFEAVYRCQRVTGVKGLQARGYFLGHGPVYEERANSDHRDDWHQGVVEGQAFRWRGDPSHHNYSDAIHGLGQYYDLAAEGIQKRRARQAIDDLVSYWVDNELKIYKLDRSRRPVEILGITDGRTLNTRVMMAIAGAKVAHHATGKEKFERVYRQLLEQFRVRELEKFETEKDFDDAEHVFCHLENLFRIEKDQQLRRAYAAVADGLWKHFRQDGQSLFTYIYFSIRPEAPGRDQAMADALKSLMTWPTEMTLRPRMNSLRSDLQAPYPVHSAVFDNEYIWKGNLLRPDGWLSRIVVDIAVSREDPFVVFAIDQSGDLYMSRDGASSYDGWQPIELPSGQAVTAVAVGPRSRMIAVTTKDGFFATTTSGRHWKKLAIPADGGTPQSIRFDSRDRFRLLATTSRAVYRSRDFGEEFLGQSWECLTDDLPVGHDYEFVLTDNGATQIYARLDQTIFSRTVNDDERWKRVAPTGLEDYTKPVRWLTVDPQNPLRVFRGSVSKGDLGPVCTLLHESIDGGQTWTNDLEAIFQQYADGKLLQMLAAQPAGTLSNLIVDPHQPKRLYAVQSSREGLLISDDAGESWRTSARGMAIPLVKTFFAPRESQWLFAGTPAGLFVSKNRGESWESAHLVLQFTKNRRRELGGAAFIDAYWRARYYGFIDSATADRMPE
jgi:photosystem II stability/assembly factor-like uncharacterized protein